MKHNEVVLFLVLGAAIWIIGTIYFAYTGRSVLETTQLRYWITFVTSPVFSAVICVGILRWRHVAHADWASAMLPLTIPGMIGEAMVLTHLGTFMPRIQETSGGKYGALLFATYALVLGMAEAASWAARR